MKTIKKILSLTIAICMILATSNNTAYAAEQSIQINEVQARNELSPISVDELRVLFPDLHFTDDGYIVEYINDSTSLKTNEESNNGYEQNEIIEQYSSEYNNGKCWLNVHSDGSYEMYGYEEIVDDSAANPNGSGSSNVSGKKYKTYWTNICMTAGYYYTYTLETVSGTSYSKFTNLGSVVVTGSTYLCYFSAGLTGYTRSTQTASNSAKIYGQANLIYNGYDGGTFNLTTYASNGTLTVKAGDSIK